MESFAQPILLLLLVLFDLMDDLVLGPVRCKTLFSTKICRRKFHLETCWALELSRFATAGILAYMRHMEQWREEKKNEFMKKKTVE